MLVNGAGSRHVRLRSFFFLLLRERDDHRLTIPTVSSLVAQFLTSSKELGIGDTRVSISRARLSQEYKGGRAKKENKKKRRRRKSRNGRRSLDGIRYVSWNRPAAIRLGPSAEMLEDILYSKRVVTLV